MLPEPRGCELGGDLFNIYLLPNPLLPQTCTDVHFQNL